MGIGDEAFMRALRRADRAPDLCGGNRGEARVTAGSSGGQTGPLHNSRGMSPPPGSKNPNWLRKKHWTGVSLIAASSAVDSPSVPCLSQDLC